jgi:endonuclease/exonuclease/phosphatase (EEP) superfamily protein YafD
MSCGLKLSRESLAATAMPEGIHLHGRLGCEAATAAGDGAGTALDGDISVLLWNVAKGRRAGWEEDLRRLAAGKDLVLLQEAVLSDAMRQAIGAGWNDFSPGYRTAVYTSGVWTASAAAALAACSVESREPLLRTPKMALIVEYPLAGRDDTLLVANLHAVNFALGLSDFKGQLEEVAALLAVHEGPVLLAGDFNTWSRRRYDLLAGIAGELGLRPADYSSDYRLRAFGWPLDHIFYRGMELLASGSERVRTSDHNPVVAELTLDPPVRH